MTRKVRERVKWRKIANRTKTDEDEMAARKKRTAVGKAIKTARREHLRKSLENLDKKLA